MTRLRAAMNALLSLRFYSQTQPIARMFEDDKRRYLADIARSSHVSMFIETGTYLGKTASLLADVCQRVVTVEIEPSLYERASELFKDRPHVQVLAGDSRDLMPKILADLTEPALFWLDGHFSGGISGGRAEPPITSEIQAILRHPIQDHIVVIDDARLFRGRQGYPQIREIVRLVEKESAYKVALFADLIRIQREDI